MSDKIEIKVTVNNRPGTLADVSLETLTGMRDKAILTVKPIEHGDYGYIGCNKNEPRNHRLFVEVNGKIHPYCGDKVDVGIDANFSYWRNHYTITSNIFKDMQENAE